LRSPANSETTICEVKPLQGKLGQAKQRHIQNMTVWKLMINKHKHTHIHMYVGGYNNYVDAHG
jgi:hypothetical protein